MPARPDPQLPSVELLDDDAPARSSDDLIGRPSNEGRARWRWLVGIIAAMVALALYGSVTGGSDDMQGIDRSHVQTGLEGDSTPSLTPDGVPEGVLGPFDSRSESNP